MFSVVQAVAHNVPVLAEELRWGSASSGGLLKFHGVGGGFTSWVARFPEIISYRMARRSKKCQCLSLGLAPGTLTVPMTTPGSVATWIVASRHLRPLATRGASSLQKPKWTRPSLVMNKFSGFRSRWMIPFSCAAANPCATYIMDGLSQR